MRAKVTDETAKKWLRLGPVSYGVNINPNLVLSQELDQEHVGEVFDAHGQKCFTFNRAIDLLQKCAEKKSINEEDKNEIDAIVEEIRELEFMAQRGWKFNENPDFHNWWLDIPGCECPRMDNFDYMGTSSKIHTETCPWHGWFTIDSKKDSKTLKEF
jgi:hypothetical protein